MGIHDWIDNNIKSKADELVCSMMLSVLSVFALPVAGVVIVTSPVWAPFYFLGRHIYKKRSQIDCVAPPYDPDRPLSSN